MAATSKHAPWQPAEVNGMEMLYRAGWRWESIAAHVSGIYGNERTRESCRSKAREIMLTKGGSKSWLRRDIDADLEDLLLLGYDGNRIARELGVARTTVTKRAKRIGGSLYHAWLKKSAQRQAESRKRNRRAAA